MSRSRAACWTAAAVVASAVAVRADVSFKARRALEIGYRPAAVELVDMNQDGGVDILAVNTGEFSGTAWVGSNVQVFLNAGGDFDPAVTYVVPDAPYGGAVADLDGDRSPDVVVACAAPDLLAILLNDGKGALIDGGTVAVTADPIDVVAADLDGDGDSVPDECQSRTCPGDANDDGVVDPLDSGFVLSRMSCAIGTGDAECDASDQNGDGSVDPLDAGFVLSRFGKRD